MCPFYMEAKPNPVNHMPRPISLPQALLRRPSRHLANYQTNLNHAKHSKSREPRLTLSMLWFLRVPFMVRLAFALILLGTLVGTADAARIQPVRTRAHASIGKAPVHRSGRTLHRGVKSHISPARARATRKATVSHRSRATRRSTPTSRASRLTSRSYARHTPALSRTRYNRYHSRARFVRAAAVSTRTSQRRSDAGDLPTDNDEANSASGSEETSAASSPRLAASPSGSALVQSAAPREPDTLPASGTDPGVLASAGNPLASPHESSLPVSSSFGPVAELTRPPIFTGRVSSYSLRGTHDSLVRQNERSEEENLERIENDADLHDRIARGLLVHVPESASLAVNPTLPEDRRYCRPWTAGFLIGFARAFHAEFHAPIIVSSAVRTVEYQMRLMRINGNAADAEGDIVSPHLTGATIDIAKSGLSRRELQWMRRELLAYQNAGLIDVEEEFHQRCFHITVYRPGSPVSPSRHESDATGAAITDGDSAAAASPIGASPDNR
jgi:hypothetical protein